MSEKNTIQFNFSYYALNTKATEALSRCGKIKMKLN